MIGAYYTEKGSAGQEQGPKVSIIIPNFNHAPYLKRRLDSVVAQTYGNRELIVLDDCSTDGSASILEEFSRRYRAKLCQNKQNSGNTFLQWAKGLSFATGKYVWLAESDDIAHPEFLSELVSSLEAQPSAALAYCLSDIIDSDDRVVGSSLDYVRGLDMVRWTKDYIADGSVECGRFLIWKNIIQNASAVVVRKDALEAALPVDKEYKICGDWLVWVKLIKNSKVVYRSRALNSWRKHSGSVRSNTKQARCIAEALRVQSFILRNCEVDHEVCSLVRRQATTRVVNILLGRYGVMPLYSKLQVLHQAMVVNPFLIPQMFARGFRFKGT